MPGSSSSISSSSSSSSAVPRCQVSLHVGAVQISSDGYSITAIIEDAICLPKQILVFQRTLTAEKDFRDGFSHVASPADIEEYPVDEPIAETPFYRADRVTLVFRHLGLLSRSLADLKQDICSLVETIEQMESLAESQLTIGG